MMNEIKMFEQEIEASSLKDKKSWLLRYQQTKRILMSDENNLFYENLLHYRDSKIKTPKDKFLTQIISEYLSQLHKYFRLCMKDSILTPDYYDAIECIFMELERFVPYLPEDIIESREQKVK